MVTKGAALHVSLGITSSIVISQAMAMVYLPSTVCKSETDLLLHVVTLNCIFYQYRCTKCNLYGYRCLICHTTRLYNYYYNYYLFIYKAQYNCISMRYKNIYNVYVAY